MRVFPELVMMLKGLLRSLRAISSSLILVSLMVYTWAILIHSMMKDEQELNDSFRDEYLLDFSTVTRCMWALFLDGTLMLDNAGPLMTRLMFSQRWNLVVSGFAFFSFTLLSALLILQMLIGV